MWANHNGPEEANGNEASLLLANQERGVAESNSSGGKQFSRQKNVHTLAGSIFQTQSVLSDFYHIYSSATTKDHT